MDKFGIFKLLNSFLGTTLPQNDDTPSTKSQSSPDLSGFLSAFSNLNNTAETQQKEVKSAPPPLQASMLSVMNSHDQFVKRVKEKHGAKTN